MDAEPTAWLVKDCPNVYFATSLSRDQIFVEWGNERELMTCAYWDRREFVVIPLFACEDDEAEYWVDLEWKRGVFDRESAEAIKHHFQRTLIPVRAIDNDL